MTPPYVCFDMDDTLVNTRAAVTHAYHLAGVTMPADAFGKPWHYWLPSITKGDLNEATRIHEKKTRIYAEMLMHSSTPFTELPAARIARELISGIIKTDWTINVCVLTCASRTSTRSVLTRLGIDPHLTQSELGLSERVGMLLTYPVGTVYVDDDCDTINTVRQNVRAVHSILYDGQSYDELRAQILGE
jgi:hypothetical protein